MPNMSLKKNPMPSLDANVRNKNFEEVALGYTEEMAIDEAERCLHCKNKPCVNGCPVGINIPDFIAQVKVKNYEEAYKRYKNSILALEEQFAKEKLTERLITDLKTKVINLCGHRHVQNPFIDWDKGTIFHCEVDSSNCYPWDLDNIILELQNKLKGVIL